ncbi:DUF397 domain-containing protein [Sphaerisporangium sp. NPDC049002]|uniref:DUF397 domain-containing protein n=1 Tax=unclassified Sphaerisporangium TaxID=2630420 RepID=UPI0033E3BC85
MDQSPPLAWRKSVYSTSNDNCVEVAVLPGGGWLLRDSKNPHGPILRMTGREWQAFIGSLKRGELD